MNVLPPLFLTREAERLGSDRELRHHRARGSVTRIATGVFIDSIQWAALDADERYRTRIRAAALISRPDVQFSHDSAAALWRLPTIGAWPAIAHQLTDKSGGGSSRVDIRRHGLGVDPLPTTIDDVTVTSLARTLIDMSCTTPFVRAVAMVDEGLREPRKDDARWSLPTTHTTKPELLSLMDALGTYRGMSGAQRVVDFASGLSGSPGESFTRVQFRALGYPAPELQVEFFDDDGFIGIVDFYWPELDLIAEFDGRSKYGALRRYQQSMSLEQMLMGEKDREDRLRRVARSFTRLDWARVSDRRRLAAYLRPLGLVERRRAPTRVREPFSAQ